MGRPPMPPGSYGRITVTPDGDGWLARCRVRDLDGVVRQAKKQGRTKARAEQALKRALAERVGPGAVDLGPDTRFRDLIDRWLDDLDHGNRSAGTKRIYRHAAENHIRPALGALTIREITVPAVDRALKLIGDNSGASMAKTCRSVLSSMFKLATRHGASTTNPVREVSGLTVATKRARALTDDDRHAITDALRTIQRAVDLDLPDLAEFMLAEGVRIGEACAVRYGPHPDTGMPLLDLDHGAVTINATVVRIPKVGLVVQEHPKSAAGERILPLTGSMVDMLRRRLDEARVQVPTLRLMDEHKVIRESDAYSLAFPSPLGLLRDPNNTSGDFRELLDAIGCEHCNQLGYTKDPETGKRVRCDRGPYSWVTSHVFRKTAITRLDAAGLAPREVSDFAGHSRVSMTQDRYLGRETVVSRRVADVLDD